MSEENTSEEEVQPPAMGGMLLTMLFMVYILLNPEMRVGMGNLAENILEPQIGFEPVSYTHLTLPTILRV